MGALFTRYDYQHNLNELVVFVTPEIVTAADVGRSKCEVELYNDGQKRLRQVAKKLKYSMME